MAPAVKSVGASCAAKEGGLPLPPCARDRPISACASGSMPGRFE